MKRRFLMVLVSSVCAMAEASYTLPAVFGNNVYQFVTVLDPFVGTNNTWATANASAAANTYQGINGHLATVSSALENDFLYSLAAGSFVDFTGAWLGGKSPEGWQVGPEAGQGFVYSNFGGSEPNNAAYAYMNIGSTTYAGVVPGQWADITGVSLNPVLGYDSVVGYFVEYEGAGTPEPGTVWVVGGALGALVAIRRFRGGV